MPVRRLLLTYIAFWMLLPGSLGYLSAKTAIPARPVPPRLVNDFAGMLSEQEQAALERKLVAYNDSTSTQITVVTIRSLDGADYFDFSMQLASQWGIGQDDKDNGILLFASLEDRKMGFQTGYGVEGFLPDALARRIIETILKPAFRAERYYEGLDKATDVVMQLGSGEYEATQEKRSARGGRTMFVVLLAIFLMLFVISSSQKYKGDDDDDNDGGYWRQGRYGKNHRRNHSGWGGGWMIFPSGGRSHGGGGGGGWFGDSDGGGFGGFGGGDFGGGGAWGDW
jgi:uncharacterized protein